jgi:CheY-like chemotaxis protein
MKVLVVDDDKSVRGLIRTVIKRMGLEAVEAADGVSALDWLGRDSSIGVAVLDLEMEGMHGREVCAVMEKHWPDVRVIISSGNVTDEDEEELGRMGVSTFLRKPYPVAHLREAVRFIIGPKGGWPWGSGNF